MVVRRAIRNKHLQSGSSPDTLVLRRRAILDFVGRLMRSEPGRSSTMSRFLFVGSSHSRSISQSGLIARELLRRLRIIPLHGSLTMTGALVLIATFLLTIGLADRMKEQASQDRFSVGDELAAK